MPQKRGRIGKKSITENEKKASDENRKTLHTNGNAKCSGKGVKLGRRTSVAQPETFAGKIFAVLANLSLSAKNRSH